MRRFLPLLALLALVPPATTSGCAGTECNFSSQCARQHYCYEGRCYQDCQRDFDCGTGEVCSVVGQCVPAGSIDGGPERDGGTMMTVDSGTMPPRDGGTMMTVDSGTMPPRDGGTMMTVDSGTMPPRDGGTIMMGTGRYLDRCNVDGDCTSAHCVDDVGGTRMCTRSCTADSGCASEHVCAGGFCVYDDTGRPCSTATPATCAKGLCLGTTGGGAAACTKPCANAADCPAGYACSNVSGMNVCVDIEKPCTRAADCATGLCIPGIGCTATCRNAADCPGRFAGFPAYTCEVALGSSTPICNPPADIIGDDPIGAICPAVGTVECRSDACNVDAVPVPMCTQACTERGGCAVGLGCRPEIDGSDLLLACARAGSRALGSTCAAASDCDTALCDATASVCTRLCTLDSLCPTGWTCDPVPGFGIAICRP